MMPYNTHTVTTLDAALGERHKICGTREPLTAFPKALTSNYFLEQIGLIVCHRGTFSFLINGRRYNATEGQTVFLTSGKTFCVEEQSDNLLISFLFYDASEIRKILGDTIIPMKMYALMAPAHCDIMATGEEEELCHFITLLSRYTFQNPQQEKRSNGTSYEERERISLLLALTYRMCSIFSRAHEELDKASNRKMEIFVRLIELVDQYYNTERGVAFYADKLCLSPKYLSTTVKSVCGNTVQEVIFMAITRRCIFLMRNTNKTIQQIADEMHFPNISSFGTFFKKQTGMSPRHYRKPNKL